MCKANRLIPKGTRAVIMGLLDGKTPEQLPDYADPRLKATPDELREALEGDL